MSTITQRMTVGDLIALSARYLELYSVDFPSPEQQRKLNEIAATLRLYRDVEVVIGVDPKAVAEVVRLT